MRLNHSERVRAPARRVAAGPDRTAGGRKKERVKYTAVFLIPEKHPFLRKILHQRMAALNRFRKMHRAGKTIFQLFQKRNSSGEILFENQKTPAVFQIVPNRIRAFPDCRSGNGIRSENQKITVLQMVEGTNRTGRDSEAFQ